MSWITLHDFNGVGTAGKKSKRCITKRSVSIQHEKGRGVKAGPNYCESGGFLRFGTLILSFDFFAEPSSGKFLDIFVAGPYERQKQILRACQKMLLLHSRRSFLSKFRFQEARTWYFYKPVLFDVFRLCQRLGKATTTITTLKYFQQSCIREKAR